VVFGVLLAVLVLLAMRGAPAASTGVVHHPHLETVVVEPGDTLWSIARQLAPGSDPRPLVTEIERLNDLSDAGTVRVGEPLFMPRPS
jgi:nucleoid-associated protein YgaU